MRDQSRRQAVNWILVCLILPLLVSCSGSYQPVTSFSGEADARHVDPYDTELVPGQVLVLSLHSGELVWGTVLSIDTTGLVLEFGKRSLLGERETRVIHHAEVAEMWVRGPATFPDFFAGLFLGVSFVATILVYISVSQS